MRVRRVRSFPPGFVLLSLALVLFAGRAAIAQRVAGPHGSVELIAEEDSISPGRPFWAGLHFVLEKGWHIYWVNPGDSGEPPRVQWSLPAGFRADPIAWPTPKRLGAASVTDYGYENEVLLLVRMHAAAELRVPGAAELSANVKWLVCKEICLPAKASVSLALPVRNAARPSAWHELFQATRRNLPKLAPPNWKVSAATGKGDFLLTIETGTRVDAASFFPLRVEQIKNSAPQQATPFARGIRVRLKKSDQLLKPVSRLQGVIVLAGRGAFEMDAPVVQEGNGARGDPRDE